MLQPTNFEYFIYVLYRIGQFFMDPSKALEEDEVHTLEVIDSTELEPLPSKITLDTTDPVAVLEFINSFIQGKSVTEAEVRVVLDTVISDHYNKTRLYAAAAAKHKIHSITTLLQKVDDINTTLFSDDRISRASTHNLIKMSQELRTNIKESFDFIQATGKALDAFGGQNEVLRIFQQMAQDEEKVANLTPASREKLRQIMTGLEEMAVKDELKGSLEGIQAGLSEDD